jgi:hypothetical protein
VLFVERRIKLKFVFRRGKEVDEGEKNIEGRIFCAILAHRTSCDEYPASESSLYGVL